MSRPPLLTVSDVSLTFGGAPIFSKAGFAAGVGDRLCLVGRNGSGKSTLLKIAAGLIEPDAGVRFLQPGAKVSYLPQDPDLSGYATLGDYAAADVDEAEQYRADMAMEGLKLNADADTATASGGERRRAALARMLAGEPDLMLLDEPTNHLDIHAIEWLEDHLSSTRAGFILISHDRAFLTKLTRGTLWVDRGEIRRLDRGFGAFEDWRDKTFEEEDAALHKLDRQIKREEHWVTHGVSGRRKRNVRRMAALQDLRAQKSDHVRRDGPAAMALESGRAPGKRVIEAEGISKTFGDRAILEPFSLRILRGDRVAIVGPNGAGKTTLLKMLIGEMSPDTGSVTLGATVTLATLDQTRALDPFKSLWETLTDDALLGIKGSNDQVMVRGRPKHVVGYLKEFLFDERQARGPVSSLSGGERARLLLAKIMARESNLLVLDEPTNDLDLETLDLLQELLDDYDGALLLVSHDRDFIDRVATTTVAMEGDGRAMAYPGGWSDYHDQRAKSQPQMDSGPATAGAMAMAKPMGGPARKSEAAPQAGDAGASRKLSFKQRHRLDGLPKEMDALGKDIVKLEGLLADPNLYARDPQKFAKATAALTQRQQKLAAAEEEWLELEALREDIEG